MVGEGNKQLVRRLYATLHAEGDLASAREILAEDYVDHDIPGIGEGGREELIAAVQAVRASFPDVKPELFELVAEDDLVAVASRPVARIRARSSWVSPLAARRSAGRRSTYSAVRTVGSWSTGASSICSRSSSSLGRSRRPREAQRDRRISR